MNTTQLREERRGVGRQGERLYLDIEKRRFVNAVLVMASVSYARRRKKISEKLDK